MDVEAGTELFSGKQVNVEATFLSADCLTERVSTFEYDLVPSLTKSVSNSSPSDDGCTGRAIFTHQLT